MVIRFNHIIMKEMAEIFDGLSMIEDPVSEEDHVVHLLTSFSASYSMLVTAFETRDEAPKMEVVTESLMHEEKNITERVTKKKITEGISNSS